MRALWRVHLLGGRTEDLAVEFDRRATIGEVAAGIAGHLRSGGATVAGEPGGDEGLTLASGGHLLDPSLCACEHCPRSGSTVELVAPPDSARRRDRPPAPVVLRGPAGSARLSYGSNRFAPGVTVEVGTTARVLRHGDGELRLNGARVRGNAVLRDGDLMGLGHLSVTVDITGVLRPPAGGGPTRGVPVSRATVFGHVPAERDLPEPPAAHRMPGFPWLTALVPLAMAAAVWFTTRSTLLVAFMAFSFVYVLASAIESRRESRAADRFAVAEFLERAASAEREMEKLARSACHRDEQTHPAATEALGWCRPVSHRLWERSGLHPAPLVVRVGHALLPRDDTVRGVDHVRADLRGEMDRLRAHGAETERPLVVDLALTGGLALIGDAPTVGPLADAVVAQLAALVPPGSLAVELPETERWDWARWLPHATSPGDHLLRVSAQEGDRRPPARRVAAGSSGCGPPASTLWVAPDAVGLPEEIRAVVQVDNHGVATLQVDHDPPREFTAEVVKPQECEDAARALAGLDAGRAGTAPSLDSEVSLESLGLLPDPRRILEAWGLADPGAEPPLCERFTRGRRALMVELGLVAGGGSLSVDLVRDGPHVLVAGTTGSGKSELLRTMLLGLAARYPPGRVTMYLVDYKGGAAFGPLTDLPHCVGLMTDLRADGTARTLEALRAELRRRETLVERHGANDLDGLDPGAAPPSLLLVVDEFATLVAEAPEFLEGVLDVAQRGRSLGIHLVLATQRPAGVVSDSIRANTNLRIALRLPDAHDSEDVVGSPAAAGLSRDLPGLALVRLGHDELVRIRVAYTGREGDAAERIRVGPLSPRGAQESRAAPAPTEPSRPAPAGSPTEIEALIDAVARAHAVTGLAAPRGPVPPALPEVLHPHELPRGDGAMVVGLLDRPDLQRLDPMEIHTEGKGGVLVLGTTCSGATNALALLAAVAAAHGGWTTHVIDAGGGASTALEAGHVLEVAQASDHEGVRRLLGRVGGSEPGGSDAGARAGTRCLLIVDGYGEFERAQERVNRGWAVERLRSIAADAARSGTLVAVSARRRVEVPPGLLTHLGQRLCLRAADEDEAASLDAPSELAHPELPAGRLWSGRLWAQLAMAPPPAPCGTAELTERLPAPARLPARVVATELERDGGERWELPIAVDGDDLGTARLDLRSVHAMVTGPPRSGRTTALDTICAVAGARGIAVVRGSDPEEALRRVSGLLDEDPSRAVLVALDDLEAHLGPHTSSEPLESLLSSGSSARVVASVAATALARSYEEPVARLRAMRTGVVLGPEAHALAALLDHDVQAREDLPAGPGRGWLLSGRDARPVQVALP